MAIGALMNARGLMELIILNIGLERGLITPTLFTIMVAMTLVTTLAAGPFGWAWRHPSRHSTSRSRWRRSARRNDCRRARARDRDTIVRAQMKRLAELIRQIHGRNVFYTRKLDAAGFAAAHCPADDFVKLPLTTKAELVADQQSSPPWGTMLTEPLERYTRHNQTSATTGRPLRWLDTNDSWQWMLDCWKRSTARRAWPERSHPVPSPSARSLILTAFEAGCQIEAHCIPAGGMSARRGSR